MARLEFTRKIRAQIIARANGKCEACSVDGCERPKARRGLCHAHYYRLRVNGEVGDPYVRTLGAGLKFLHETALSHDGDDCLFWPFGKAGGGSGHLRIKGKDFLAHRLVCEMVNGLPPTNKHEAAHSCGKGHLACVSPKHLRWATRKENEDDKLIHGTLLRGSKHSRSKLTEEAVTAIRIRRGKGELLTSLAEEFGVSISLISMVYSRKVWGWFDA